VVFLLSQDYPFAKSLVPVLISEDLLRKGKALERKRNKNCGTANQKQLNNQLLFGDNSQIQLYHFY